MPHLSIPPSSASPAALAPARQPLPASWPTSSTPHSFPLDLYYRDLSQFPLDSRDKRNFDHPDSLESELFIEHVRCLARGEAIQRPVYDFRTHSRVPDTSTTITPCSYVIVEGILALHYPELLPLYRFSIYVDAPNEICLNRRIYRDMRERGPAPKGAFAPNGKPLPNPWPISTLFPRGRTLPSRSVAANHWIGRSDKWMHHVQALARIDETRL